MSSSVNLDEIDITIIRALQRNARTNFVEIAKDCSVSTDTIIKRFERMKKSGVIRGTTILLNPRSLGYNFVASLEIDVDHPHVHEVVETVGKRTDVLFCTQSMGRHDIFVIVFLKNVEELSQIGESIKSHPMVGGVTSSIWVDEMLLCPENFEFKHIK